jgi:hypothetical protein
MKKTRSRKSHDTVPLMIVRVNFKLLFSDIKQEEMKISIFFVCRKAESPPVQLLHIERVDKLLGAALLDPAVPGGLPGLPALLRPRPPARGRDGDLQHCQHQLGDEHKHTQGQQCTKLTKRNLARLENKFFVNETVLPGS